VKYRAGRIAIERQGASTASHGAGPEPHPTNLAFSRWWHVQGETTSPSRPRPALGPSTQGFRVQRPARLPELLRATAPALQVRERLNVSLLRRATARLVPCASGVCCSPRFEGPRGAHSSASSSRHCAITWPTAVAAPAHAVWGATSPYGIRSVRVHERPPARPSRENLRRPTYSASMPG